MAYDLRLRLDGAIDAVPVRVLHARGFVRELAAAEYLALETFARRGRHLFVAEARDVAAPGRTKDRQAVAFTHVVLAAEIDIDDLVDRRRFAQVAREHDASVLFAARVAEAVEDRS